MHSLSQFFSPSFSKICCFINLNYMYKLTEQNSLLRPTVYVLIYFEKPLLVQTNSMSRNTANKFVHGVVEPCMGRVMINSFINED